MEKGANAVGIILSGTGSDGARGIGMIKSEAGFTFVQDPETAKYDGMPNAAIQKAKVDFILSASEIAKELKEVLLYPSRTQKSQEDVATEEAIYQLIYKKLEHATKVDFGLYKSSSLHPRIERRMVALKIASIKEYNNFLGQHPSEIERALNARPRKCLGFRQPVAVFNELRKAA